MVADLEVKHGFHVAQEGQLPQKRSVDQAVQGLQQPKDVAKRLAFLHVDVAGAELAKVPPDIGGRSKPDLMHGLGFMSKFAGSLGDL